MLITQSYAERSTATLDGNQFNLKVAAEQSRPPVRLEATVLDSQAYARLMQTLYNVVTGDLRARVKDHTAYQMWVQQRYLDELAEQQAVTLAKVPGWTAQRDQLKNQISSISHKIAGLAKIAEGADFDAAKRRYFNFIYKHDFDAWMVLDPVVSVHPDNLIFEAFSKDESSYGRVTVPLERLAMRGAVQYGTTNIDFSPDLAREIARIRSYRPTNLMVSAGAVSLATAAGSVVEKKIDLPPSWVRGFLQVQSAATLPGTNVYLSAATMADILTELERKRETVGPRSLKFILKPGELPQIIIEPWGVIIQEHTHRFDGQTAQEVRIWGRRRLLVLRDLLPHATQVVVRLMGTGMPTYWSVFQRDLRFDMGLSGWTQNDWSKAAQFDLLASTASASQPQVSAVSQALVEKLFATPAEIAVSTGIGREAATAALQQLCREGRAMYDHVSGTYRWRQLFPFMPEPQAVAEDPRLNAARRLIEKKGVVWLKPPQKNAPPPHLKIDIDANKREFEFRDGKSSKFWNITLEHEQHTVQFGRIGTSGQEQTKWFDSNKEAKASFEKLIREKLAKGYVEITKAAPVAEGAATDNTRYVASVKSEKTFTVTIDLNPDGRVVYAECTCGTFRRDKLRKGPCAHILATTVLAAQTQEAVNV